MAVIDLCRPAVGARAEALKSARNPTMMNFLARNGAYLTLFSIGAAIVLMVAVLLVRRRIAFLKIRNSPLTPAEALRKYNRQSSQLRRGLILRTAGAGQ